MKKLYFLFFLFFVSTLFSQSDSVFKIKTLTDYVPNPNREPGLKIDHCWKYHKGDDLKWANVELDTKDWKYVNPLINLSELPNGTFENCGWFRLKIEIDTQYVNKTLALLMVQKGASEIYIDGKLVHTFGYLDPVNLNGDTLFNPQNVPVGICFENKKSHVLAIRYRNKKAVENFKKRGLENAGFDLRLAELDLAIAQKNKNGLIVNAIFVFYFAFFIALGILHFLFFLFYRSNRSNLYYSLFALSFGIVFFCIGGNNIYTNPDTLNSMDHTRSILAFIYSMSLIAMLYSIFYKRIPKIFWLWFGLYFVGLLADEFNFEIPILSYINALIIIVEPIRIIIVSIIKKREGAWIIGTGVIATLGFFTIVIILFATGHGSIVYSQNGWKGMMMGITVMMATLSIPISMSIFLARDFAKTSKNLEKKLIEVEDLSAKSIEQEKEKQQILADQNITLEKQVAERTHEVVEQKKVIEEKNKDITDSIAYAKRIQDATLPSKELKYKLFPEAFVLFKPKDIVSGDFYWFMEIKGTRFIAAADCTGHGVPGALVSVVCSNALNRAVKEFKITEPGKILDKVRELVLETFASHSTEEKNSSAVKDGMDISLCSIPPATRGDTGEKVTINWAGANNPFWYIQQNELKEIKANKQPIGKTDDPLPFTTHTLELNKGDIFYLFTDGYADQFGGEKGKKFKYKQLEETFLDIHTKPMMEQEAVLDKKFDEWKAVLSQVDDVLVIGVKV